MIANDIFSAANEARYLSIAEIASDCEEVAYNLIVLFDPELNVLYFYHPPKLVCLLLKLCLHHALFCSLKSSHFLLLKAILLAVIFFSRCFRKDCRLIFCSSFS